jgi:fatty-acyl-CoA synthase
MQGLMMDYQLTIPAIMRRAEQLHADREIRSRRQDKGWHTYTYGDFVRRAKQLGGALVSELGLRAGDRVATLAWNHHQHLEVYLGSPSAGLVTHTLNLRLHPDDLAYIATHAGDRVLVADKSLWQLVEAFRGRAGFEHVIAVGEAPTPEGAIDYEDLLATQPVDPGDFPDLDERTAAAMCYTSGTTGRPKGVVYSHRAIVLHSLATALKDTVDLGAADTVMPVVPMFHANAWGFPFTCSLIGAAQVFPGPHLDPVSLLDALAEHRVTVTAGVPTIWMGILQTLDANPGAWDLSALRSMVVGGSAPPRAMIEGFRRRHGLAVLHAWGMTEMTPLGSTATPSHRELSLDEDAQFAFQATQGRPTPLVEIRARGADRLVTWNGETMGELEVRGPWIAASYHEATEAADRWTEDGWFRTGDIVTIDPTGTIQIQDREKDLVKSGGEWISTVALENALMGHPAVAEAAVIAVPDEKWAERPLAVIVFRAGESASPDELREFLAPHFARWWLPERFEVVEEIPKTAVGKFKKTALRERFG